MNSDSFHIFLGGLSPDHISFEAIEDGRHILYITLDIGLYVRPAQDDADDVIAGLWKLADAAMEMAAALGAARQKETARA